MKQLTSSSTDPWPPLWFFMLSHHSYSKLSHTIRINLGSRQVYLCARCTGIGVGMLVGLSYVNYLAYGLLQYPALIVAFVLPAIVDWLFQVFRFKNSTNPRRLVTGVLVGQTYLGGLIALARGWFDLLLYYALAFAVYALVLYAIFRMTGVMSDYLASSWP
ncbi:MAG TPA: DUF2085 domain-containing protein [Candidatus Angelobacter sp.]|nr:DUF2085 domain-containing protein [Candidatus Angelobacter sp.]